MGKVAFQIQIGPVQGAQHLDDLGKQGPYQWKHIISQRVCRRNTDETRIVLLKIWQELYALSPALFAPGLTGPFCQRDKCLEGKMTCGRKIDADMMPEDLLKADYPALFEGGGT